MDSTDGLGILSSDIFCFRLAANAAHDHDITRDSRFLTDAMERDATETLCVVTKPNKQELKKQTNQPVHLSCSIPQSHHEEERGLCRLERERHNRERDEDSKPGQGEEPKTICFPTKSLNCGPTWID